MPLTLSAIVGDAVNNLRSALDYLTYQLLDARQIKVGRHHYFPVSANAEMFEATYGGKVKGIGQDAERLIKALKPYQRWD